MNRGTFSERLLRGVRWAWTSEAHRDRLPADLVDSVMSIESSDRYHAKQGRSTARVRFDGGEGPGLSVYLKRHFGLPTLSRIAALVRPSGRDTPATVEWSHLEAARRLGIPVPKVVAAGETIGPWGGLCGFLMVEELAGAEELNLAIPRLARELPPDRFAQFKRSLIVEAAEIAARLHHAKHFHKDLYLCHYFLESNIELPPGSRLTLIDLHRLERHRLFAWRWMWKDVAQLLFSTFGVEGIEDRDRLRFWKHYRRIMQLRFHSIHRRAIMAKAERYRAHND
ncbi:MAG: lipopolysaccharide kinase InaA family protein [Isosphaeraceae bacterium]|nr:lipopolysaccharide kinase InaA family protein [Isosphaeraceae bacterium]